MGCFRFHSKVSWRLRRKVRQTLVEKSCSWAIFQCETEHYFCQNIIFSTALCILWMFPIIFRAAHTLVLNCWELKLHFGYLPFRRRTKPTHSPAFLLRLLTKVAPQVWTVPLCSGRFVPQLWTVQTPPPRLFVEFLLVCDYSFATG